MELQDTPRFVARYFHNGLGESFARHIRALERFLREDWKADLERINVLGIDSMPLGQARMIFKRDKYLRVFPPETPAALSQKTSIFIFFGLERTPSTRDNPDTSLEGAERPLNLDARIALAHEIAHVALGHCFNTKGELRIPHRMTRKQEAIAYAYAYCLVKVVGDYLRSRSEVLITDARTLTDVLYDLYPDFELQEGHHKFVKAAESVDCAEKLPELLSDLYRT